MNKPHRTKASTRLAINAVWFSLLVGSLAGYAWRSVEIINNMNEIADSLLVEANNRGRKNNISLILAAV
jgi:hypothetical protein